MQSFVHQDLAERYFKQALKILHQPSMRSEAWLDVYRLRSACRSKVDMNTLRRIQYYPDVVTGFLMSLEPATGGGTIGYPNTASLVIDLRNDEYLKDGIIQADLPKKVRLIGYLKIADKWGINTTGCE